MEFMSRPSFFYVNEIFGDVDVFDARIVKKKIGVEWTVVVRGKKFDLCRCLFDYLSEVSIDVISPKVRIERRNVSETTS